MNATIRNAIQSKLDTQSLGALGNATGPGTPKKIFAGLRLYVNGYTKGTTRSEITRLVDLYGGSNL